MQHPFHSTHDFAPLSLRFNGRIKEGSTQTLDQIRWARPRFDNNRVRVTKRIRFDADLFHRFKSIAN